VRKFRTFLTPKTTPLPSRNESVAIRFAHLSPLTLFKVLIGMKQKQNESDNFFEEAGAEEETEGMPSEPLWQEDEEDEEDGRPAKKAKGKIRNTKKKVSGKSEQERKKEAELALLTLDENIHAPQKRPDSEQIDAGRQKKQKERKRKGRKAKAVVRRHPVFPGLQLKYPLFAEQEAAKAAANLNLQDPRFRELVTSPDFAIDPTRCRFFSPV